MASLFVLTLATLTLYLLSRVFIQKLFIVLYRFTGDKAKAAFFLGLIFLPGTFIHEISHFITALFLVVPVGKINLIPQYEENSIKLGSVAVGKSDFIRASIIGLAPLLVGGGILFWATSYVTSSQGLSQWMYIVLIYLIFQITHTMFSSKRDVTAVLELVVFIVVVSIVLVFLKIIWPFEYIFQKITEIDFLNKQLLYALFVPIILELVFLTIFRRVRISS